MTLTTRDLIPWQGADCQRTGRLSGDLVRVPGSLDGDPGRIVATRGGDPVGVLLQVEETERDSHGELVGLNSTSHAGSLPGRMKMGPVAARAN